MQSRSGVVRGVALSGSLLILLMGCSRSSMDDDDNDGNGGNGTDAGAVGEGGASGKGGVGSGGMHAGGISSGGSDMGGSNSGGQSTNGGNGGSSGASGGAGGSNECTPGELDCECAPVQTCGGDLVCRNGVCLVDRPAPEEGCFFTTHESHDYFFCDSLTDHDTAAERCSGVGMTLVHIDDADENAFINEVMTTSECCAESTNPSYKWAGLWIGATDAAMEGVWLWEDDETQFWEGSYDFVTDENGQAVGGRFASWATNQPNNNGYPELNEEQCARTAGLLWSDLPCTLDVDPRPDPFVGIGYICEQPSVP